MFWTATQKNGHKTENMNRLHLNADFILNVLKKTNSDIIGALLLEFNMGILKTNLFKKWLLIVSYMTYPLLIELIQINWNSKHYFT